MDQSINQSIKNQKIKHALINWRVGSLGYHTEPETENNEKVIKTIPVISLIM